MARVRVSTTVDPELLSRARAISTRNDSSLIEEALRAYVAAHSRAVVDEAYRKAYAEHPLQQADEWGDLASFGAAVRTPVPG